MACVEALAGYVLGPLAPDGDEVVGLRASAPDDVRRAGQLAVTVGAIVLQIDSRSGPVVLAGRVDRGRVAERALVLGYGLGCEEPVDARRSSCAGASEERRQGRRR